MSQGQQYLQGGVISLAGTIMSEWAVGDVCLRQNECGNKNIVLVEKILPNGFVRIENENNTNELCHPDELHRLTADFKPVDTNIDRSSILKNIDDSYFLNRLCELASNSPRLIKGYEKHSHRKKIWREDDICICIWSVDKLYYYAKILSADYDKDLYTISYFYYENVESKKSGELFEVNVDYQNLVEDEYNIAAASKIKETKAEHNQVITKQKCDHLILNTASLNTAYEDKSFTNLGRLCTQLQTKCSVTSLSPNDEPSGDEFKSFSSASSTCDASSTSSENSTQKLFQNGEEVNNNLQTSVDYNPVQPKMNLEDLKYQPLLLSWFLCGYQTGYHEVVTSFQRNPKP